MRAEEMNGDGGAAPWARAIGSIVACLLPAMLSLAPPAGAKTPEPRLDGLFALKGKGAPDDRWTFTPAASCKSSGVCAASRVTGTNRYRYQEVLKTLKRVGPGRFRGAVIERYTCGWQRITYEIRVTAAARLGNGVRATRLAVKATAVPRRAGACRKQSWSYGGKREDVAAPVAGLQVFPPNQSDSLQGAALVTPPTLRKALNYVVDFGDPGSGATNTVTGRIVPSPKKAGSFSSAEAYHVFSRTGRFQVSLRVVDDEGRSAATQQTMAVWPPGANFTFGSTWLPGYAGGTDRPWGISFYPDPYAPVYGGTPAGYEWSFGDGASSREPEPTHLYPGPGSYNATLVVIDGFGTRSEPYTRIVTPQGP